MGIDDHQSYPGLNTWSEWSRCDLGKRQKKSHSCSFFLQFEFLLFMLTDQISSGQDYQIGGEYQIQAPGESDYSYDYQNAIANAWHRGDNSVEYFQRHWFS